MKIRNFSLLIKSVFFPAMLFITAGGVLAAGHDTQAQPGSLEILPAVMLFLLPLGLILLLSSEIDEMKAPTAAIQAVISWLAALLGYILMGFAFEFGGLAVINNAPDFSSLAMEWSPFSHSLGSLWGVIGLEGFALSGVDGSMLVMRLLIAQAALIGCVAGIEAMVWQGRSSKIGSLLRGLIIGGVCFPLAGNWIYGGGWLANLGKTQQYGHGFVDFAAGGQTFLLAGVLGLGALIFNRLTQNHLQSGGRDEIAKAGLGEPARETKTDEKMPPSAHLPIINLAGAVFILMGLLAFGSGLHIAGSASAMESRAVLNILMAAIGGGLASALYAVFTTSEFDGWMIARGIGAGAITAAAAAPFIPVGAALLCGTMAGLLLPFVLNGLENRLKLTSGISSGLIISLIGGLIGLAAVGFFADGKSGMNWNGIGLESYLGIDGQGVSGLWVAQAMSADFPGQFIAQLIGMAAIILWGALFAFLFFWLEWAGSLKPALHFRRVETAASEDQSLAENAVSGEDRELPPQSPAQKVNS